VTHTVACIVVESAELFSSGLIVAVLYQLSAFSVLFSAGKPICSI